MWMDALFERVCRHLDKLGVKYELLRSDPLSGAEAARARDAGDMPWPEQLWEILTEFANGFTFRWPADQIDAEPFCEIEFPDWRGIQQGRVYLLEFLDEVHEEFFRRAGDPELAKMLAAKGTSWFPFLADANADQVVVDARTGHVRLHLHDWCDGGSGDNGFFMAESLKWFFDGWSRVCFAQPLSTLDTVVGPYGAGWECPREYRIWS
jgi:hypothetical protein